MCYALKYGVTKAARKYNRPRSTIYFWLSRYDGSIESLDNRSKRPHSHPNQHTEEELKLIRDMRRRNPNLGLIDLWCRLKERGYTRCPESLYRVLKRLGALPERPKKQPYKPKPYEQMTYPGQRVQIDVKVVPRACCPNWQRFFQYTAIDEFSRLRYLAAYGEQSTYSSADFLINQGLAPRMKQMVRQMIRQMEVVGDEERLEKFHAILRDIPKLWAAYRHEPLKSRLGSNSASRSRSYGMGLAIRETLPRRALASMKKAGSQQSAIPIYSPVEEQIRYNEPENPSPGQALLAHFRFLPGCGHLGMERRRVWRAASEDCRVSNKGNMVNLGGLSPFQGNGLTDAPQGEEARPDGRYLNSSLSNCLKVLLGFIPAFVSFIYTQDWWFLAWFGTFIWFGITGVRNVVQMVMAARGAKRSTLTHWREHVSVKRICDSLMYTGISVLLLEVMIRVWLLEDCFGVTVAEQPVLVFTVLNIVNGFYIFAHNVYRGFPREAAIGNLFRSALAIPVSSLYDFILFHLLLFWGIADPHLYLVPSAAVISKMASDTVAAIIEGYADSQVNLRMRRWDYESTIKRIFDCYTQLELLFPREDALICLARPGGLRGRGGEEAQRLERILIICALDLMYFWFYQPRAQEAFRHKVRSMAEADRAVLLSAQLVLMREREVSQFLVDGLLGRNFSKPLAFFLDRRKEYLRLMARICILSKPREAPACPVLFGEDKKS